MNPYEHTHVSMQRIHERLVHWVRDLLIKAGVESVQVYSRFLDEKTAGPHLVLLPYRLEPYPKNVESDPDIPLLGTAVDRQGVVPDGWARLGELMTLCLDACYPRLPARGTHPARMRPLAPLDELPPPLRAWYKEQGDDGTTEAWMVVHNGKPHGRLPSLAWRRPLTIRASYLIMASDSSMQARSVDAAMVSFAVPALAVVCLGMQMERKLTVQLPPIGAPTSLVRLAALLGKSTGGELGEEIMALADAIQGEQISHVSVLPMGDLGEGELASVMRSLDRPFQPVVNLAVQVGLGGGPVFVPGLQPMFSHSQSER